MSKINLKPLTILMGENFSGKTVAVKELIAENNYIYNTVGSEKEKWPSEVMHIFDDTGDIHYLNHFDALLHPKLVCELASAIAKAVSNTKNKYIVETHSDYFLDRIRIDIRNKNIKADDVGLVWFNNGTAYNITFDDEANFVNRPWHYQSFIGEETDRLLGLNDGY